MATTSDPKRPKGLGLPSAPVYRPTTEQFKNPLEFIASIRHEAEQYGICKIVPPPEWQPEFQIDTENFLFKTRIQSVSELQHKISSSPEYKEWNGKYMGWLEAVGRGKKRNPTFLGREIDLYKFHKLVSKAGGYEACCNGKAWREIARLLGVRLQICCPGLTLHPALVGMRFLGITSVD